MVDTILSILMVVGTIVGLGLIGAASAYITFKDDYETTYKDLPKTHGIKNEVEEDKKSRRVISRK